MQASSDIFLGWVHVESGLDGKQRDFYGRQLKDWKGSAEIDQLLPEGWRSTAGCAAGRWPALMPAAATGSRSPPISARATRFDRAILDFSKSYAEQNERDYKALAGAVKSGRIAAQTGL